MKPTFILVIIVSFLFTVHAMQGGKRAAVKRMNLAANMAEDKIYSALSARNPKAFNSILTRNTKYLASPIMLKHLTKEVLGDARLIGPRKTREMISSLLAVGADPAMVFKQSLKMRNPNTMDYLLSNRNALSSSPRLRLFIAERLKQKDPKTLLQ